MKTKLFSVLTVFLMLLTLITPPAHATGLREGGASLLLPTYGQSMNGETYKTKTKIMAGVEFASITTVIVLGTFVGGAVVWAGLGPLIANHLWSSVDAYKGAQVKKDPQVQAQIMTAQMTAQKNLELSRQGRFDRMQDSQSDLRSRIAQAGQVAR